MAVMLEDTHQRAIAAFVLLAIGGVAGFWLGRSGGSSAPSPVTAAPAATPPAAGTVLAGGNAVAVNDQPPGLTVSLGMVAITRDGWVVIHAAEDGAPGRILGARRFDAGSVETGSVELLRPTEEGRVYFAMLHADNGDRQFDHTKDLPLTDAGGNVILMRFVASTQPEGR